ncbi:CBS domain-containing protein [Nocardia sp. ET3-3]|uniref:CBS domain-containing protein n=1 Tax=Nocardia terrae TaxID=2675851 RepID=A0A7K1UVD4_9NOCA|nr:CBS domain-containing protein [Nocardia terrae]MVU78333.1 CBS domain-containing protein [Nocardia terrae]
MKHKTVADVMTREVVSVRTDAPFREIVGALAEHGVSGAPVLDAGGRVIGVVSEADLLGRPTRAGGRGRESAWDRLLHRTFAHRTRARTAAELMNSPAVTLTPATRLPEAAATLARYGVKRAPVVDENGEPVGIVSRKDLLRVYLRTDAELAEEVRSEVLDKAMWLVPQEVSVTVRDGVVTLRGTVERQGMVDVITALTAAVDGVVDVCNEITANTARDLMHVGVLTISEQDTVTEAAHRMRDSDIGALPVVDAYGDAIGIVTDRDLVVRCVAAGGDPDRTPVSTVATRDLHTVAADSDLADVLLLMRDHRIHRVPVCENNRLVGIITEADLARHLAESAAGQLVRGLYAP